MACLMSDDSRKALFGALRNAGCDTKDKWARLDIAQHVLTKPVSSFTNLSDDDAAQIIAWLDPLTQTQYCTLQP